MKKRGGLHRWLAIAMTVVLMAGQGSAPVLAQEENPYAETGISGGESGGQQEGAGISGTEADGDASGDENSGAGGVGEADNGSGDNGVVDDVSGNEGDGDEEQGGNATEQGKCVCESSCAKDAVNENCPVCMADYSVCAQNAGGRVKPSEEISEADTVLENHLAEEEGIVLFAVENDEKALAIGEEFSDDAGIKYRVTGDGQAGVIGHINGTTARGDLVIPAKVSKDENTYDVTSIEADAFHFYERIKSIEIPNSVTRIGRQAFMSCRLLEHVEVPKGVTSIENAVFYNCSNLKSVILPDGITRIDDIAFENCSSLENVELPDSVNAIGERAFAFCENISSIKVSASLASIGKMAFYECSKFRALQIVILSEESVSPSSVGSQAFDKIPADRDIVFLAEDGKELTGDALEAAKTAYLGDGRDGDSADETWWGWKIKRPAAAKTYTVTVNVKKDDQLWSGHGRVFALLSSVGGSFITGESQAADSSCRISLVADGVYRVYDVTGIPADSLYSGAVDTEMDVTVNGADTEAEVNYYTATFYDGAETYQKDTPQKPQTVLRGQHVLKPADPGKADCDFAGWKTDDGGSTPYDFNGAVMTTTGIYASWVEKPVEKLHITATATEGGTIAPAGEVSVTKGGEQNFAITQNEGYRIKSVTVDGRDVTGELAGSMAREQEETKYYTFTNVTENHTIHAAFETDSDEPGEGDEKPGEGDDKPGEGDDKPGEGDDKPGEGDDKPDEGDDATGGGDKPGGDNNPGGDDKPDEGDNPGGDNSNPGDGGTGNVQTVAVVQTASPQTGNGATGNPSVSGKSRQGIEHTTAAGGNEPKTGDPTAVEVYATVAMIAGLTYLLLYFMEERRGMTEWEKEVFVAAFIRWAKKGGRFRKCCAIAAIFCLLVYYHSIGKRAGKAGFDKECLRQAL